MSQYRTVQFISWELYTGPFDHYDPVHGWYAGLHGAGLDRRLDALGQCRDIEARLAYTADAIHKAEQKSQRDAQVLKIFMAPEFLYRGAGGAYLHDLINGWSGHAPAELQLPAPYAGAWDGLFGGLRALVADPAYEDWLFVFGSALSASFPTAREADQRYVLDPARMGEIYNSALIQRGGPRHRDASYVSRKHYRSDIDFVNAIGNHWHTHHNTRPLEPRALIPADFLGVPEGGAVFTIAGINDAADHAIEFGIEICLDHALSGGNANHFGRLRSAGQVVKIQLVPSGGMELAADSVRLQAGVMPPRAYAFNCDGMYALAGNACCHTQLWRGADHPAAGLDIEVLVDGVHPPPAAGSTALAANLAAPHGPVAASELWGDGNLVQGAGQVHVLPPYAL